MNILITAPDLDTKKNVSGVSSVVNIIVDNNNKHTYFHYLLGSPDKRYSKLKWMTMLLKQLIAFPLFARKNRIEAVHQNLPFDPKGLLREYIVHLWCRLLRLPVLLHVHGGVFLMSKPKNPVFTFIAKSMFRHSKTVVVLSELERKTLEDLYGFCKSQVLNNCVDTRNLRLRVRNYRSSKATLLVLGRIHESKGVDDVYEAVKQIKEDLNFNLVMCGSGPLKEDMVNKFNELLSDRFYFGGIVSGEKKKEIIANSDFFLLPSRYGEGLPMALLETMAAGVIPVVTDDASMKFIVENGVNGLKVNKYDPNSIATQLTHALSNPEDCEKMSENARKMIDSHYNIEAYIPRLNRLYEQAV